MAHPWACRVDICILHHRQQTAGQLLLPAHALLSAVLRNGPWQVFEGALPPPHTAELLVIAAHVRVQVRDRAERDKLERERAARERADRREKEAAEQARLKAEREARAAQLRRERIMMERADQAAGEMVGGLSVGSYFTCCFAPVRVFGL